MQKLTASEIKFIKSLSRGKDRDAAGMFVVEGEKMVREALESSFEVVAVYRRDEIGEQAMSRISSLSSPSPALAIVRQRPRPDKAEVPSRGLFLMLDSVRDPGNMGTILRICDWFGVDGVYASPLSVDIYNPKVVQATMGAIFRVNFQYTELEPFAADVLKHNGKIYGTFLDGDDIYSRSLDTGKESPSFIVMGNESEGISPGLSSLVGERLFIPSYGSGLCESLNVAVATAVTVAEFRRRG